MHALVIDQRHAEYFAVLGVGDGFIDHMLHALEAVGGGKQTLFLELHHLHHEAHAFLTDQVALGYAHVIEEHLGGFRRTHAQLVQRLVHGDAGRILGHHDQGFIDVGLGVGGVGQQAEKIGTGRIGDPHFGAIDHVVIAVFDRGGFHGCHIGTCMGFGNRDGGHHVAGDGGGQVVTTQFIGAEAGDGWSGHVGLYTHGQRYAATMDAAHFFAHNHAVGVVQPHAAKLFRLGYTEQTQIAHFLEHFMNGETPGVFPFTHMGVQFLVDKIADGTAKFFVFLSELHGRLPVVFVVFVVFGCVGHSWLCGLPKRLATSF